MKALIHKLYRLIFFRDAVDPQPINEIIPSALGIHIIDTQHKIVMSIATHTAILDMILAWLKGSNSERKVSIGIITELLFYTKELGVEEPLLRESLGRYRPRTEELLSGTVEPCVGRMLYLLASEIYPGLPCPGFSEADLPADISVHHGAGGVLLLMKIWGKGKIGPSEYASVATYIREFIPEYPYYLGLSVMEGRIALLDGTLGPALALEL